MDLLRDTPSNVFWIDKAVGIMKPDTGADRGAGSMFLLLVLMNSGKNDKAPSPLVCALSCDCCEKLFVSMLNFAFSVALISFLDARTSDVDILRWWKGAHPVVCEPNDSNFSKVLPHLQRKGIFLFASSIFLKRKKKKKKEEEKGKKSG